eukprot:scaffold76283_cov17-Prasinocladus_malaysianus.AAC.1
MQESGGLIRPVSVALCCPPASERVASCCVCDLVLLAGRAETCRSRLISSHLFLAKELLRCVLDVLDVRGLLLFVIRWHGGAWFVILADGCS